ncbi:MAG: hypothetical protein JST11_28740 [Acidobacteria bacterium]|nr:hypothetical protein [Acidobacteriota bacterium]
MRVFCLAVIGVVCSYAQTNILTANGNNERTNANLQETSLSPATVTPSTFGKLGSYPVDGQVYAQPLYAAGIRIGGAARNVLYIATMHNTVYAFDAGAFVSPASSPVPLWSVNLGPPVPAEVLYGTPYGDISDRVGILATPAIDPALGVLYAVAETLVNGAPAFTLHALDLATGAERLNGPTAIQATVAGPNGSVAFDPLQHIQRPGLLLANGSVYIGFGSHADQSPWHGWIMSYDAADLSHPNGVFLATPNGNGGAFWQSGRGFAADSAGSIYAISGNGDYDGQQNFSQSFLRLTGPQPSLSAWATPVNWQAMSNNDTDLSAGPALIPGTHTLIGADKAGNLYVVDGDGMGHSVIPYLPASAITAASSGGIFNLAVWNQGPSALVYVQGANDVLKAFRVTGVTVNPSPETAASTPLPSARIGLTLSANGADANSGILWETSGTASDGALRAYKAADLSTVLWDSTANLARDAMGPAMKFVSPTVADGRVYVPAGGEVDIYGLLLPSVAGVTNAASYAADAVSPGELVSLFGIRLGPAAPAGLTLDAKGMVATSLAGVRVSFDGIPAPLTYVSDSQINAVVPFGLTANPTSVTVSYQGLASPPVSIAAAAATPGAFSSDGTGAGQALAVNQDGTLNSPAHPAAPGSVITLWATGAGILAPLAPDGSVVDPAALPLITLPFAASIDGQSAPVLYAGGAPGMVEGVLQVNLQVPAAASPSDAVPLQLQVAGHDANLLTIAVGRP